MAHRTLVTGASGFAGSHLLELLSHRTDELHAWTRTTPPPGMSSLARWHTVDLMNPAAVRQTISAIRPHAVYHCAGSPHVAQSWQNSAEPLGRNVMGTHHLLDALHRGGQPCRVLVTGSATVYRASTEPIAEDGALAPVSPYALSKYAQERLALRAIAEDGLEVVVSRSFNHTGARQTPAFVAPSMARQVALIERGALAPVLRVGNLDARRDFTDVRDVVAAYAALMEKGQSGGIYNVASGVAPSMRELLDAMLERATCAISVESDESRMRPHDTPVLVGDASRLRGSTGWAPAIGFSRMVDDLLEYWRGQAARGIT